MELFVDSQYVTHKEWMNHKTYEDPENMNMLIFKQKTCEIISPPKEKAEEEC
jgi:hypothetical protein